MKDKVSQEQFNGHNKSRQANYSSYQKYKDATHRHVRIKEGPKEVLPKPLTVSQDYGFIEASWPQDPVTHARKSCEETNYACELIKSGIMY